MACLPLIRRAAWPSRLSRKFHHDLRHIPYQANRNLEIMERSPFNPRVIQGTQPGKPLADLQPFWQRVRARAGLKDARLHDLRHTFASVGVASGQGLPMTGKLPRFL
jgi:integrase